MNDVRTAPGQDVIAAAAIGDIEAGVRRRRNIRLAVCAHKEPGGVIEDKVISGCAEAAEGLGDPSEGDVDIGGLARGRRHEVDGDIAGGGPRCCENQNIIGREGAGLGRRDGFEKVGGHGILRPTPNYTPRTSIKRDSTQTGEPEAGANAGRRVVAGKRPEDELRDIRTAILAPGE